MAYGKTPVGLSSYETLAGDIAAHVPATGTILDLACGDGYLLHVLARRFPRARLIGIDMSPEELAAARERMAGRAELQLANARALPLEDGVCDAVACHMAFMLMDDAPSIVSEVARVLRPGAVFAPVVNGGRTTDPVFSAFLRALWEAERLDELAPLPIGDPRTQDPRAIQDLFEDHFSRVDVAEYELRLDGTPDQVRASLLGFYNLQRLSTASSITLQERLDEQIVTSASADGIVPLSLPLRRILAIRK